MAFRNCLGQDCDYSAVGHLRVRAGPVGIRDSAIHALTDPYLAPSF
jgi:hypothetical protein